ncbi:MAG: dihydrodipicolinate synthase family protein [Ruminococcus sp.]
MQKLYGTVVPIVTPLTEEDTIDVESLKNLVNHVIDGGLQCLYPCGTTGEMMYLTVEERKQVAEVTVKEAAGRVPVFDARRRMESERYYRTGTACREDWCRWNWSCNPCVL